MEHLEVTLVFPDEAAEKKGILHLAEDNKHWLEYTAYGYEHTDKQFPVIYATHDRTDELYTCIQCTFRFMDVTYCQLDITELIRNEHSPAAVEPCYLGLMAQVNCLTNWLGRNAFELSFSESLKVKAATLPFETSSYQISEKTTLALQSWCLTSEEPQKVSFITSSRLGIYCETPASRLDLYNHALNFLRIQSLFLDRIASFSKVELIDQSSEPKELQRKDFRLQEGIKRYYIFLSYTDLAPYFSNIIDHFYRHSAEFTTVIDLMNESRRNRTPEISFLNLTTALEVFHKHFAAAGNDNKKKQFNELFKDKDKKVFKDWVNVSRYYHLLELTGQIDFLNQRITDQSDFCKQIRNTRNWYTHYDQKIVSPWSPAKLALNNKLLEGLLKAVILQKLGLPDTLINKLLLADAELFFSDYETNPFSLSYKPEVYGKGNNR